jgi:hypothetical protein
MDAQLLLHPILFIELTQEDSLHDNKRPVNVHQKQSVNTSARFPIYAGIGRIHTIRVSYFFVQYKVVGVVVKPIVDERRDERSFDPWFHWCVTFVF